MLRIILALLLLTSTAWAGSFMGIPDDYLIHSGFGYGYGMTCKVKGMPEQDIRLTGYTFCLAKEAVDVFRGSYFDMGEFIQFFYQHKLLLPLIQPQHQKQPTNLYP